MGAIEIVETLTRMEFLLRLWADWMRQGSGVSFGYPTRSSCFSSGTTSLREIEEVANKYLARVVDSVVQDLPDEEKSVIHHQYLDSNYRYPIVFYTHTLHNAKRLIQAGIERKEIA